jgi:hypothetical protein
VHLVVILRVVLARPRPARPEALGIGQRLVRVDRFGRHVVRREPGQDERHFLSWLERQLRHDRAAFVPSLGRRTERDGVRAGDGEKATVDAVDPRNGEAVVEADDQLRPNRHAAVDAFDDPDDVGRGLAWRHEVDRADSPFRRLEGRLEDERVVSVAALVTLDLAGGREVPAPVLAVADERREARGGVETRKAAPVDGAGAVDERCRLKVAEQRVVLDPPHVAAALQTEPARRRYVASASCAESTSR